MLRPRPRSSTTLLRKLSDRSAADCVLLPFEVPYPHLLLHAVSSRLQLPRRNKTGLEIAALSRETPTAH